MQEDIMYRTISTLIAALAITALFSGCYTTFVSAGKESPREEYVVYEDEYPAYDSSAEDHTTVVVYEDYPVTPRYYVSRKYVYYDPYDFRYDSGVYVSVQLVTYPAYYQPVYYQPVYVYSPRPFIVVGWVCPPPFPVVWYPYRYYRGHHYAGHYWHDNYWYNHHYDNDYDRHDYRDRNFERRDFARRESQPTRRNPIIRDGNRSSTYDNSRDTNPVPVAIRRPDGRTAQTGERSISPTRNTVERRETRTTGNTAPLVRPNVTRQTANTVSRQPENRTQIPDRATPTRDENNSRVERNRSSQAAPVVRPNTQDNSRVSRPETSNTRSGYQSRTESKTGRTEQVDSERSRSTGSKIWNVITKSIDSSAKKSDRASVSRERSSSDSKSGSRSTVSRERSSSGSSSKSAPAKSSSKSSNDSRKSRRR
jgi:hypothetical protein